MIRTPEVNRRTTIVLIIMKIMLIAANLAIKFVSDSRPKMEEIVKHVFLPLKQVEEKIPQDLEDLTTTMRQLFATSSLLTTRNL
jgi:ABC-type transporter MlaC component